MTGSFRIPKRVISYLFVCLISIPLFSQVKSSQTKGFEKNSSDRVFWLAQLDKLARPVISSLAQDQLKTVFPVIASKRTDNAGSRTQAAYLEVFGRVLSGIAPWLNLEGGSPEEVGLRNQYREWMIPAIKHAVDPAAKDYMAWKEPVQALVDASYFAFAIIRCPWLWEHLDETTRKQVTDALLQTRNIRPGFNNWLLFSGMIETFFCRFGLPWDEMRVDYGIRQSEQWYLGDGIYSDGPLYRWDYYNSYVIHPYLAAMVEITNKQNKAYDWLADKLKARNERYAVIQERLIGTDGSYPVTGRSIVYRGAAFHHLADMAWRKKLPASLHPAQVRCALTAVLRKTMEAPGTYTKEGWLNIGLCGAQPDLADYYNTTGSLYLCANILLPLGLPDTDPFWSAPAERWTAQKVWSGQDFPGDHAID
ncbi:DUF2264 domain-containing protein [Flavitalea flava]